MIYISQKCILSRNYEFYLVIMNYWPYGLPYVIALYGYLCLCFMTCEAEPIMADL